MKLGEKILKYRKEQHLSQEDLAFKVYVTRQTISNWELNETMPNPEQLKKLSQVFQVSIDELLDNDVHGILESKISNTEKLAGIIIKILKVLGVLFILYIIFIVIAIVMFTLVPNEPSVDSISSTSMTCSIKDDVYHITIGEQDYFQCDNCSASMQVYLKDLTDWANLDSSITNIENYFIENGGSCSF